MKSRKARCSFRKANGLCHVACRHAAKGKAAVADIKTFGCFGGGVGLGFGNQY